jgi:hypothetical protein
MRLLQISLISLFAVVACTAVGKAGNATWDANPVNNRWNAAQNWTPATVPDAEDDVATFGISEVTKLILTAPYQTFSIVELGDLVFEENASPYSLTLRPIVGAGSFLTFYGSGIVNNANASICRSR